MPNALNVLAGKPLATGGVLVAPLATAGPTNANTALNAAFKALGYVGEDGLTETVGRSTDKIKAWGGDVVKVLQTDFENTYTFSLIESADAEVLKAVNGSANVTTTAASASMGTQHAVKVNSDTLPQQSFVFEMKDGNARIRIYLPVAQIIEVGDVTYNDSDVISYELTVEAFRSDALGANALKFINDGRTT